MRGTFIMGSTDALDRDQKDALEQFLTITESEDAESAISRLEHCNWNLERAIESVYDGSNTIDAERERLAEQVASSAQPPEPEPQLSSSRRSTAQNQKSRVRFRLMSILSWPFGVAWNIVWAILAFASRMLSRPPIAAKSSSHTPQSTQGQDPRVVAARFLKEFEAKYGQTHVEFFHGGYTQALEVARRDLRLLMIVLQSDEHDTHQFYSETLTSPELIEFQAQNNILLWGGNVREPEAHQVSNTLGVTTFPFTALITLEDSSNAGSSTLKMSVTDRIVGLASPATVIERCETTLERNGSTLNRLKRERDQRNTERRLRQEQDRAYRESLKIDQEKERKAQEVREEQARAEEEEKRTEQERLIYAEKQKQYIRYLCRTLPAEPDAHYQGRIAKISFRLGDGERVVRKFRGDATLEALYQFVEAYPVLKSQEDVSDVNLPEDYVHKYGFTIVSPYPRTVYPSSNTTPLQDEKSLWPSATLIVDVYEEDDVE